MLPLQMNYKARLRSGKLPLLLSHGALSVDTAAVDAASAAAAAARLLVMSAS